MQYRPFRKLSSTTASGSGSALFNQPYDEKTGYIKAGQILLGQTSYYHGYCASKFTFLKIKIYKIFWNQFFFDRTFALVWNIHIVEQWITYYERLDDTTLILQIVAHVTILTTWPLISIWQMNIMIVLCL